MYRLAIGLFALGLGMAFAARGSAAENVVVAQQTEAINKHIAADWTKAGIKKPADKASDLEFMRRAFIDLIGRIPTYEEAVDFDQDHAANKRPRLINRLLYTKEYKPKMNGNPVKLDGKKELSFSYTDEFAEHWANIWTVWLLTRTGHPLYRDQMRVWLEQELGANLEANVTPYDQLVSKLLTASGKTNENGAVNFIIHHLGEPTPAEKQSETGRFDAVPITSRVTRLFLGIQTNCTQCHDHPFNKEWIQADFWGVNAFFRQTVRDKTPTTNADRQMMANPVQVALTDESKYNAQSIIFYERRDGKLMATKPNFLKDLSKAEAGEESSKVIATAAKSRRDALSDYVLKHDNFSKAFVNRVWGHLFGRGLNKDASIDDFGSHNEVVHPEMLTELGADFNNYAKYDIKKLLFWICCSDAYGLSHVANKDYIDPKFEPYFARMPLKALSPEVLFETIMTATKSELYSDADARKKQRELWMSKLVRNFGDDEGNEMTFNGTVVQALLMMNGKELNDEVGRKTATNPVLRVIAKHTKSGSAVNASVVIDELFLSTLTRHPTTAELTKIKGIMEKGAVIAGEAPKGDAKTASTAPAKPVEAPKGTKPADKPKGKNPPQTVIPSGPRMVPGTGPNDASFYQDLFWALLNTNEFMLNH
ncbi:DUF1549 domain-containing protein [Limnoglobus roseus]|uniref:DUF1549 domain-containing protein n=1 Tax=Limnoglobus roseus TaxID=2598579 RepID=A0A5C1ACX8_9BACT|nr:DUF1549 domain-containing protein [Limnoglobus roseus]QEL16495.1 hypothetical protein PX52LOC_03452 [Limnoglobus roseus]